MKNVVIIIAIIILCIACQKNENTFSLADKENYSIVYITGIYESIKSSDTILIKDRMFTYKLGHVYLINDKVTDSITMNVYNSFRKSFSVQLTDKQYDELVSTINFKDFLKLDSIIYSEDGGSPGGRDESFVYLTIDYQGTSHTVNYGYFGIPNEIRDLDNLILKLLKTIDRNTP